MRRRRSSPEAKIQHAVVKHLKAHGAPGLLFFHVPNGGKRSLLEAVNFKRMGVRPGVADLIFLFCGRFYAMELKAPGNRPTPEQLEFLSAVQEAGGYTANPDSLDRALKCLRAWGMLRGRL